jgi:hypothetical protein
MYAPPCSKCKATKTRPSHRRPWEKPFSWLILPFRCRVCRVRFWKIRFTLHQDKTHRPVVSTRTHGNTGLVHGMTNAVVSVYDISSHPRSKRD